MPIRVKGFGFRHKVKRVLERLLRINIYRTLPHGYEFCKDIRLTGHPIRRAFDIGANIGQFAAVFKESFPRAELYSFEPVSQTFRELEKNLGNTGTKCYQLGFGSKSGPTTIYTTEDSATNSLIEPGKWTGRDTVSIMTLDQFVNQHQVGHIDLLKIDTEGFDLEVLKGAEATLISEGVSFVFAEVGFNPKTNTTWPSKIYAVFYFQKVTASLDFTTKPWNGLAAENVYYTQTCCSERGRIKNY